MWDIWLLKFNFVSTVIPRSRISFDWRSKLPPIEYIGLPTIQQCQLLLLPILCTLLFTSAIYQPIVWVHRTLFVSHLRNWQRNYTVLHHQQEVSYTQKYQKKIASISFINKRNRVEPKTLPWGTPLVMCPTSDTFITCILHTHTISCKLH